MRKFISICLFVLLVTSCNLIVPRPATEEQKKKAIQGTYFDIRIIRNLKSYYNLKYFLNSNLASLLHYRDSNNYVINVISGDKVDTVKESQNCYVFQKENFDRQIPLFLRPQFDKAYSQVIDTVEYFELCNNGKITLFLRHEDKEGGLIMSHAILWNGQIEKDYAYVDNKDTLIENNCIYRIGMTEYHGH